MFGDESQPLVPFAHCGQLGGLLAEQFGQLGGVRLINGPVVPTCAAGSPVQYQCRSGRLAPAAAVVLGDGGLQDLRTVGPRDPVLVRRTGSCQHTSGFIVHGLTPSLIALLCNAHPIPPANPGRFRKMGRPCTLRVRRFALPSYRPSPDSPCGPVPCRGTAGPAVSVLTASSRWGGRRRRTGTHRGCSSRRRAGPRRCPLHAGVPKHVQRDSSQVRSAAIRCSGLSGSELDPSAGKSSSTSPGWTLTRSTVVENRGRLCRAAEEPAEPRQHPATRLYPVRLGVLDVGSNTVHLLVVDARRVGTPRR